MPEPVPPDLGTLGVHQFWAALTGHRDLCPVQYSALVTPVVTLLYSPVTYVRFQAAGLSNYRDLCLVELRLI
jgi:hypothetical protein